MIKRRILSYLFHSLAFALLITALLMPQTKGDTDRAARNVSRVISSRIDKLENYGKTALKTPEDQWVDLGGKVPSDMVVYRYVNDVLQSWTNQFPIPADEILPRRVINRLSGSGYVRNYPLSDLAENYTFHRFGEKSYLIRILSSGPDKIVLGLLIEPNRRYMMGDGYVIKPLGENAGSVIEVGGEPVARLVYESLPARAVFPAYLVWLAFLFFCIGLVPVLNGSPTLKNTLAACASTLVLGGLAYMRYPVLSGELTQMLIILAINVAAFFIASYLYIGRNSIRLAVGGNKPLRISLCVADIVVVALLFVLAWFCILKVFRYTHISLELYKFVLISWPSIVMMVSFLLLMVGCALLIQIVWPASSKLSGRLAYSVISAIFLVATITYFGFQKEELIVDHWSHSLSNDRDYSMENYIRRVETQIAADESIWRSSDTTAVSGAEIVDRIISKYFMRHVSAYLIKAKAGAPGGEDEGARIAPGSRFYFSPLPGQRRRYVGSFHSFSPDKGQNTVYIDMEPRNVGNRHEYEGAVSSESAVSIPLFYSYAKFSGPERLYFHGTYPYPTRLTDSMARHFLSESAFSFKFKDYIHFVRKEGDSEFVIISRPDRSRFAPFLFAAFIAVLLFCILSLIAGLRRRDTAAGNTRFKNVIMSLLIGSIVVTMAILATVSVTFVVKRSEINANAQMADKVNSVRSLLESAMRGVVSKDELRSKTTLEIMRRVSENAMTEITLYRPDGRVLMSTTPELYNRMILGCRADESAYNEIINRNAAYSLIRDRNARYRAYTLYAPILGTDGSVLCMFSMPYRASSYDLQQEALVHTFSVIVVFLILILAVSIPASMFIDRLFKPLYSMGRKMERAGGVNNLEHISYQHDDEIRTIVNSYNRMVDDLEAGSRMLAQAERDKAWSEMARNVAHEIKNPLTPMQLQIQRVQRLKANGDPNWQIRFDEMAKLLLDHIEILTETANQFSDFARLYSEEPVDINLDNLLAEEVEMYNARPGMKFEYLGLPDSVVSGPRPQLVRVFVNLLNNAAQACEEAEAPEVVVQLRNGSDPDFYEIVFEDNGPGVSEDNMDKLFTPKFTTKTSGSGLGLSICKSILDRCGASISYSRSFSLGGACFTILYPKKRLEK